MASPVWPHRTSWAAVGIWATATLLIGLWNTLLAHQGVIERELLYLGEKALLVFHGRPPRLENLGFVSPPLPYAFVLITQSPLWGTAAIGGLLLAAAIAWMRRAQNDPWVLALGIALAATPPGLHLLSQSPRAGLLTLSLLASFVWLRRYCASQATVHLFLFGLVSSSIFLTAYEAVLLVPIMVLPVTMESRPVRENLAIFGTALTPSLFMMAGWAYLNWIFLGHPWAFFEGWQLGLIEKGTSSPGLANGVRQMGSFLASSWFSLLPWIVVGADTVFRRQGCWPTTLIMMGMPLLWIFLQGALGMPLRTETVPLFWACSLLAHGTQECGACVLPQPRRFLRLALLGAFVASWLLPQLEGAESLRQIVVGRTQVHSWIAERELVAVLRHEPGTVLLDDARLFPIVLLEGNPQRFLLPYEYEFQSALRTPSLFARFVVVDSSGDDQLTRVHPLARHGILPGFFLRSRHGELLLYERIAPSRRLGPQLEEREKRDHTRKP